MSERAPEICKCTCLHPQSDTHTHSLSTSRPLPISLLPRRLAYAAACCALLQERDLGDEYGWKQVHADVFRPPEHSMLFASLLGTGYQVAFVALCVILFVIMGDLYTECVAAASIISETNSLGLVFV